MVSLAHGLRLLNTYLLAIGVNLIARDGGGVVAFVGYLVTFPLIIIGSIAGLVWVAMTLGDLLDTE